MFSLMLKGYKRKDSTIAGILHIKLAAIGDLHVNG